MPRALRKQIQETVDQFTRDVEENLDVWAQINSPKQFRDMELQVATLGRKAQDGVCGAILEHRLADPEFQARTSAAARGSGEYRHGGRREVNVKLLGGNQVRVKAEYLKLDRRGGRGRRRRSGRRGKGGSGLYPALLALGVTFGASPALAADVCCQVAESESLRVARAALARRGIDLGHKPTLRLSNELSRRADAQRREWLAKVNKPENGALAGKRVVVAADGGRLRERQPRRSGRRRKNSGRRGYNAPWREPKMLVIYTIDAQGRVENEFRPVYDGTLGDCEELFEMLGCYLQALGANLAHELIFVGDGAEWIWNRTDALRERLGLRPEQVTEVIDWYHAVEVLHEIAAVAAKWSRKQRERWSRRAKSLLFAGKISALVQFIEQLAQGRRGKSVRKHIGYFSDNSQRMQYATLKEARVPLGSGAVESMIRRVVNLRIKGNAKFWLKHNAEGMLLMRSYLKAGRFDDLVDWSMATAASWWPPAVADAPRNPLAV